MPDNNKPLFWYPGLNHKFDFDDPIDQGAYANSYIMYFLNRLQSMFRYDGLPESIPQKYLENYLLVNGHCGVFVIPYRADFLPLTLSMNLALSIMKRSCTPSPTGPASS